MKRAAYAKHAVLTRAKIKRRTPETRINPHLIYVSRLEQMHVELTDEHMEAHGGTGGRYECCTKHVISLRYDVSISDPLPWLTVKNIKR